MTADEAHQAIKASLEKTLNKNDVAFGSETHLIRDGILDSLDSMVFLMELSGRIGKTISDDDANNPEFYQVSRLVSFMTSGQ